MKEYFRKDNRRSLRDRIRENPGLAAFGLRVIFRHCGFGFCGILLSITILLSLSGAARVYVHRWVIDTISEVISSTGDKPWLILCCALGAEFGVSSFIRTFNVLNSLVTYLMSRRLEIGRRGAILLKTRSINYKFFDIASWYDKLKRAERECSGRPINMLK